MAERAEEILDAYIDDINRREERIRWRPDEYKERKDKESENETNDPETEKKEIPRRMPRVNYKNLHEGIQDEEHLGTILHIMELSDKEEKKLETILEIVKECNKR